MSVTRRAIKLRLYPNQKQEQQILVSCAGAAYVWNKALEWRESAYQMGYKLPSYTVMSRILPMLKRSFNWLNECESSCLQQSLRNLDEAYQRAFNNIRNNNLVTKRKDKHGNIINPYGFPRYKSRKKRRNQSYRITNGTGHIYFIDEHHINVPKLGVIRVRGYRAFQGRITSVTVKALASGKFVLVLHVECEDFRQVGTAKQDIVGVDVGSRKLAVTSNGIVYENPRAYACYAKRLRREQRSLARKERDFERKQKNSTVTLAEPKNISKCRKRIAILYEKMVAIRMDTCHKASFEIVRDNQAIVLETLNVKSMLRNSRVARSMSDASVAKLQRCIRYKASWYDRDVLDADRWFASSKICSCCGYRNDGLSSLETWVCPSCGSVYDRDFNAAVNLEYLGRTMLQGGSVTVGRDTSELDTFNVLKACGEFSNGDYYTVLNSVII